MAETNAFAEAVRKMTPHVETDDSGIWLMDGETPLMEVRPEQIMHTEAHYLLDEMCRAVVTVRQQQDARTESLRRVREALERSEDMWSMTETAAGVSNTYGIPIGDVSKIRAAKAGKLVRAALSDLAAVEQRMSELEQEKAEHDASFDLRWKADMRAIQRWQEERPEERQLTWPDHADLCVWLMERVAELEADKVRLNAALVAADAALEEIHDEWAEPSVSAAMGQIAAIAFRASCAIDAAREGK